jgi:hypothetical protein
MVFSSGSPKSVSTALLVVYAAALLESEESIEMPGTLEEW